MAESEEVAANINVVNAEGFVAFFKSMSKDADLFLVRMFNRGDYYTIHGDTALMVAKDFLNTNQGNVGSIRFLNHILIYFLKLSKVLDLKTILFNRWQSVKPALNRLFVFC